MRMEETAKRKSNLSYYINSAIVVLLMFLVPMIPPFGQITAMGMKVLGVFVGMLYGWLTVGFVWPSMLGLIMVGFTGATDISKALSAGFGNINLVIYSILGFMFATYLDACNLTGAIAGYFMSKKFIDKKPYVLVGLFFAVAYILAALVGIFAGIFVTWAILYKVIDLCGYERQSLKVTYLVAMIPFAAVAGMIFPPFHATAIMYTGLVAEVIGGIVGQSISYSGWMAFQLITAILMMLCYLAVGKFIFKFDFALMANVEHFSYLKTEKMNFEQKFGMADLILLVIILLIPEFLPEGIVKTTLAAFGVGGGFLLAIMLPAFVKGKDGKPLADIKVCMAGVSWEVIWMLIATGPVSAAMQSADCGIVATMVGAVTSMFGDMHWMVFTFLTALVLGLLTQITHNVIIAIVLFGPFALVCQNLGGNPTIWFIVNFWMNMAAFMTPAASVNSALIFGNTEWVAPKYAYLTGTIWFVINLLVVCLTSFTIGNVLL